MSAYKVCVANVVQDNAYKEEIDKVIGDYDFDNLDTKSSNKDLTFLKLLELIQQDASTTVKLVLTCCSILLANLVEKNEAVFIGIVSQKDSEAIITIKREVKLLEYRCNEALPKLNTKFERLEAILKKDKEKELYLSLRSTQH